MPAYNVKRSIVINVAIQKVRDSLTDYRQWPLWSPWLIMEPETKLNYNEKQGEVGAAYDWKGELIGEGAMELSSIADNELEMFLQFEKPFKSTAAVKFELEAHGSAVTNIIWSMDSKLPFFLFWMVNKIKAYIGMDYERGLKMLKDYLETGSVASKIKVDGVQAIESQQYIGLENQCRLADMANTLSYEFKKLKQFMHDNDLSTELAPFTIYISFDIENNSTSFISAIPIDKDITVSSPFIKGEIKGGDALKVTHTGHYEHLGNAWTTVMAYARAKKIKTKKSPVGIEFYLNDPMKTAPEELITEVYLPLK